MRIAFFLLFTYGSTLLGADVAQQVRISEALHRETIAHLELKAASLETAIATVREFWEQQHPKDPFPVGLTNYVLPGEEKKHDYQPEITFDLKNVPYIKALEFIGMLSSRRFIEKGGFVNLEEVVLIEDWVTREYSVTPTVLKTLGLNSSSSAQETRTAFENLGVQFEDWMTAGFTPDGLTLIITNVNEQHRQIAGIVSILKKGFTINKP